MMNQYILLVDDNPSDVEITISTIKQNPAGLAVTVANDGKEALDFIRYEGGFKDRRRGWPSLILLDIKMPKVDGMQVLRSLKSDPEQKAIPVVVLTSSEETRDIITAYELGTNGFVVKPVDFTHYRDVINKIIAFWLDVNKPPSEMIQAVNG